MLLTSSDKIISTESQLELLESIVIKSLFLVDILIADTIFAFSVDKHWHRLIINLLYIN